MKNVLIIVGTRPEAIKLIPVYRQLVSACPGIDTTLVSTGQHRDMLQRAFAEFDSRPDVELDVMVHNQSLAVLESNLLKAISGLLEAKPCDLIVVQGDTTTSMAAAVAAFYRRIPIAHVEAGLRSHSLDAPFPEEFNRRVISMIAGLHFAATEPARQNLLNEGVPAEKIFVTGNTVIDSLLWTHERVKAAPPKEPEAVLRALEGERKLVLVTCHRRESFGSGLREICAALSALAQAHRDVLFVIPVHPNPSVKGPIRTALAGQDNISLIEPLEYTQFVYLMGRAYLLLTDSGGVQEEAPSLGKPVLVMREVTERPEGVTAGVSRLVGASTERIVQGVSELLADPAAYRRMQSSANPYGDGRAAERIAQMVQSHLFGGTDAASPGLS